ncbi:MAG: HEPN domain-containing protein [Magnetococcales bacterium]|nr:HEPN domain-containing protein [Magnetococcales bacterium]MBF0322486.1 HEPN domain-containing protein [Magnetococcales bacterium]
MNLPHIEEALRSLRLADRDIAAFETLRDAPRSSLVSACFHAQQAVEKCLKAVLFQNRIEFRRTHDLTVLTRLLRDNGVTLPVLDERLAVLNPCAVDFRYDEETADLPDRESITALVTTLREWSGTLVG